MSVSFASRGASTGANRAVSTTRPTTRTPFTPPAVGGSSRPVSRPAEAGSADALRTAGAARAGTLLIGPPLRRSDARVEVAIEDVDQQVDEDHDQCHEDDRALDDREIAELDRLDDQPADAGPGE